MGSIGCKNKRKNKRTRKLMYGKIKVGIIKLPANLSDLDGSAYIMKPESSKIKNKKVIGRFK